jgi:hypothetical protein
MAFLAAAMYALTGNEGWLSEVKRNVCAAGSAYRVKPMEALALVADRLAFDDPIIHRAAQAALLRQRLAKHPLTQFYVTIADS